VSGELRAVVVFPLRTTGCVRMKSDSVRVCIRNVKKGDELMSKGMDSKKSEKKEPAKTMKEKKADKKIKKAEKK
jgi:hypothetical protein